MNAADRELLARTLQAEAGGEGYNGLLAAGAVIANRVKSGSYGDGWRGVIMKPGQFSAWNSVTGYAGGKGGLNMTAMKPSADAYRAADAILSGRYEDPTGGATHYYNPAAANPAWGKVGNWTRIGNHVFGNADAGRGPMNTRPTSSQAEPSGRISGIDFAALADALAPQSAPAIAPQAPPPPQIMPRQVTPYTPEKRDPLAAYMQFFKTLG